MGIDELKKLWNAQADLMNGWDELGIDEIVEFAQTAGKWQPIATAPHDKQVLLYKDGGDMHVGRWVKNPYTGDEAFAIAELGEHGRAIVHPTHWAELPMPPNAKLNGEPERSVGESG